MTLQFNLIDDSSSTFNGPGVLGIAQDGTICLFYGVGGSNFGLDGGLMISTTSTDGVAWSALVDALTHAGAWNGVVRCTKITTLASGTMILGISWDAASTFVSNPYAAAQYTLTSTDNGATWTLSSAIPNPSGAKAGLPTGQIIETSAGGDLWWLWPIIRTADTTWSCIVMVSTDHGATWGPLGGTVTAATVFRDASQLINYDECDLCQLSATDFLAMTRTDSAIFQGGVISQSRTTDTGSTWSAPSAVTDTNGNTAGEGLSPALFVDAAGGVVLSFGERSLTNTYAPGLIGSVMSVSSDGGTTWMPFQMLYSQDTHPSNDAGSAYTSAIQLDDGSFVSALYIASNNSHASLYSVRYLLVVVGDTFTIEPFGATVGTYWNDEYSAASYWADSYWPSGSAVPTEGLYWESTYWANAYWSASYWPGSGVVPPPTEGVYWASDYWANNYWSPSYWPGVGVTPPVPPVAAFVGAPLSGHAPLTVTFTDQSTGSPTSWLWDFGDGSGSTQQDPAHTYAIAGSWTVTLTASNAGGSSTLSKPAYVTTTAPVPPAPPSGNFSGAGGGVWVKTKSSRMERDEFPRVPVPDDGEDVAVPLALVLLLAEA